MRYLSVCSGMEAATVAWSPLGWRAAAFAEVDPHACAVLAHHYPAVPNFGDMNRFKEWPDADVDVLVGGTPCQSFSIAGLRKGLDDPRGNLALTYLAIADRYRPEFLVWENVPGVLSSNGGRDFGAFLGGLGELGYGFAYGVLDAQYFGVPQRRRRVFVVGHSDWRRAAAVLFERASLSGDSPPRREAGQKTARPVAASSAGGSGYRNDADTADSLVSMTLNAKPGTRLDAESETFVVSVTGDRTHALTTANNGKGSSEDGSGRGVVIVAFSCKDSGADVGAVAPTLRAMSHDKSHQNAGGQLAVAFNWQSGGDCRGLEPAEVAMALQRGQTPATLHGAAVRRLTPVECLRLQGFPDDYLDGVLFKGKPLADGPRYRLIGNSMAVPVMRWIGERIDLVRSIPATEVAA
jgi:DNA (cytosine-5)-methyltransferase 1